MEFKPSRIGAEGRFNRLAGACVGLLMLMLMLAVACSSGYQAPTIGMSSSQTPSADKTAPPFTASPSRTPSVLPTQPSGIPPVLPTPPSDTPSVLPTRPGNPDLGRVSDPFEEVQTNLKQLVTTEAQWHAPDALKVDEPDSIGLQIGDSAAMREAVGRKLPGTQSSEGGPVTVGPTVSVRLVGDPEQVEITPKEAIVQSTTRDVAMLFTWIVKPKTVTDDLHLQAIVEVPLPTAPQVTSVEIPLNIKVKRTLAYTFGQIFSHWATWAAIAAAVLTFFRRIRNLAGWPIRKLNTVLSKGHEPQVIPPDDKESAEARKT